MARCVPYLPQGYEPNRALIESIKKDREKAKKERKKEKKKERKEKSEGKDRNCLKRNRQHDEACLLHPSNGDVSNSRSAGHCRKKRQCNEILMLHESGNMQKKGFIEQLLGDLAVTEGGAAIYMHNPLDKQDGDIRMNVEQTSVTEISVVLGSDHQKFRKDTGNCIKRKRRHDEACLLHSTSRDDPNPMLNLNEHHNKKRQCTGVVMFHDNGNMPKKGFIEKEQIGGSVVTEQGEGTLYMHNSFDSQDSVNKKDFEKTDGTKSFVGSGLRIRVPLPKHKEPQNSNQICESQSILTQCSSHDKVEVSLNTQHDKISAPGCKTGVAQQPRSRTVAVPHLSGRQAGTSHQICGSQATVQQHGTTAKVRVQATIMQAGVAHVRQHGLHAPVIKKYELFDDVSKQTGHTSEIFRTDNIVQRHPAPLMAKVRSASGEAVATPVRQHERPAAVIKQDGLSNSVGEMVDSLHQICGGRTMLQKSEAPAMDRMSAAKQQPEAASVSRPHEVPSSLKHHAHAEVAGEKTGPSQISGSRTMVRKHKVSANDSMSTVHRHNRSAVASQDLIPPSFIKHQTHHQAAGTSPQSYGNGALVEKPKAPVKVRVSAANRQAGHIPFLRKEEPFSSDIKRQAPVIKHQGCHGEPAGTSPQTRVDGAVVEKCIAPGEARVSTVDMQTGVVTVKHDKLPISVNKQPGRSSTIDNKYDFSSFPRNSHPESCASVLERTEEPTSSIKCFKPPVANIKKEDVLSVLKQEKKDLAPPFHYLQAEPTNNKKPESVVASIVQPVTPDTIDQPSFSGRKEKSCKPKDVISTSIEGVDYSAFRGSSSSRRQEARYRDLMLNWKAVPLETKSLAADNDLEWLYKDAEKPPRQAITGCQLNIMEDVQAKVISPTWPPRASLLPEVDLHALPFVVPF